MRYLLINFLFLSLVSCGTLATTKGLVAKSISKSIQNPYFSNVKTDYVYKAKIDVNKNHFGGLLIVKKMAKNHHRVVFTTEFGNKIFDFEFTNNIFLFKSLFKVNYIMDKLDKKIIVNALKKDFQLLVSENNVAIREFNTSNFTIYQTNSNKRDNYYYINKKNKQLEKVVMASKHKEKVTIKFNKINNNLAKSIQIKHHNFNMNMQLNYIN